MKYFVKEITWLMMTQHGWGNGYVCIPKWHPLFGKDYDEIHRLMPNLEVHGGLTFSRTSEECKSGEDHWVELPDECAKNHWIIGFDCAHAGDNQYSAHEYYVRAETARLAKQIEDYQPVN